jgi:hypothetical protein
MQATRLTSHCRFGTVGLAIGRRDFPAPVAGASPNLARRRRQGCALVCFIGSWRAPEPRRRSLVTRATFSARRLPTPTIALNRAAKVSPRCLRAVNRKCCLALSVGPAGRVAKGKMLCATQSSPSLSWGCSRRRAPPPRKPRAAPPRSSVRSRPTKKACTVRRARVFARSASRAQRATRAVEAAVVCHGNEPS